VYTPLFALDKIQVSTLQVLIALQDHRNFFRKWRWLYKFYCLQFVCYNCRFVLLCYIVK